jgi:hypothetical protein
MGRDSSEPFARRHFYCQLADQLAVLRVSVRSCSNSSLGSVVIRVLAMAVPIHVTTRLKSLRLVRLSLRQRQQSDRKSTKRTIHFACGVSAGKRSLHSRHQSTSSDKRARTTTVLVRTDEDQRRESTTLVATFAPSAMRRRRWAALWAQSWLSK